MSFRWYFNRLRSMGAAEVAHRLKEHVLKARTRGRLEGWGRYPSSVGSLEIPNLRRIIGEAICADLLEPQVRIAANRFRSGQFSALGMKWPNRTPGCYPDSYWRLDPVTGKSWPGADVFSFDISYRHARSLGDIKYVWELNRLQFLQVLAANVLLFGDSGEIKDICDCIDSWYEANPPFRGVAWNSGIEISLRCISLLVVAALVEERLPQPTTEKIGSILRASATWILRFPSRYSSANNHRIAELACLFLLGYLPGLGLTPELDIQSVQRELERESLLQILEDGVPAEQSPTYGAFTSEFIWLCAQIGAASLMPFAPAVVDRLQAFSGYIQAISNYRGTVPAIGDDDEGRVVTAVPEERAYPLVIAKRIRPAMAATCSVLDSFRTGGYTVLRGSCSGHYLEATFDHGPLGYLSIAAHGHADALSISVSIDGAQILIDPGTYLYHSGGNWRDWFRSTAAHNTLTIDGQSQSIISGPFNWRSKAFTRLLEVGDKPLPFVAADHDGFVERFGVRHVRKLEVMDWGLNIWDALIGNEVKRDVELVFQLAADCQAYQVDSGILIAYAGTPLAILKTHPSGRVEIRCGSDGVDGGWCSPRFGVLVPAPRISWRGQIPLDGITTKLQVT